MIKNSPVAGALLFAAFCAGALISREVAEAKSSSPGSETVVSCARGDDVGPAFEAALRSSASSGARIVVEGAPGGCVVRTTLAVPSGARIEGINSPVIAIVKDSSPTLFSLNATTGAAIKGLTLDGGTRSVIYRSVSPIVSLLNGASGNSIEDITVTNSPRDIRLDSANNNTIRRIRSISPGFYKNTVGDAITYNAVTLNNANQNVVEDVFATGHAGWVVGIVGTSANNVIKLVKSSDSGLELIGLQSNANHNTISDISIGQPNYRSWAPNSAVVAGDRLVSKVVTKGGSYPGIYIARMTGTTGNTAPSCGKPLGTSPHPSTPFIQCSDGEVQWVFWRDYTAASDNCVSITGYNNSVERANLSGCRNNGIVLYGEHNSIKNSTISNVGLAFPFNNVSYYAIGLESAFGGVSQFNTVTGNRVESSDKTANVVSPIGISSWYRSWAPGIAVKRGGVGGATYLTSSGQLYRSLSEGETGPDSAPTHVAGIGKGPDGIEWEWVRAVPNGVMPMKNSVRANVGSGGRSGEFVTVKAPLVQANDIGDNGR